MVSPAAPTSLQCRSCGAALEHVVLDLGDQPLANAYVQPGHEGDERRYSLCARLCLECGLVQVGDLVAPAEIFSDYAYFSSYSESWVAHARAFATEARARFGLEPGATVVEIASNDGYLLQHFRDDGLTVLGVEPAANVAEVAIANGIPTVVEFFGAAVADQLVADGWRPDLLVANNVLAHVPALNDFIAGIERVLALGGVVSIEAPHLLKLVELTQFDTIYHEHFSYLSLLAVTRAFARHGLRVFDVAELATHGGSLRILAARADDASHPVQSSVERILDAERAARLDEPAGFAGFADRVWDCCAGLKEFLAQGLEQGRRVVAYGAAAKGNTLLNAADVDASMIDFVVDRNPHKQGLLLPGSHIPIHDPARLIAERPDDVLILPWNLRDEVMRQMDLVRGWGGHFVTAVPTIEVW